METKLTISKKYTELFKLLNIELLPEVDTVIMTGGRASGKSFTVALFSLIGLVEHNWNVLYTRYTNMSITDSVKPEVTDKIELLNYENKVVDTQSRIECGNNRISFKGIKTGSKIQTANLKSLSNYNCFVVDEAEEIPDFETFKKVFYSIRSVEKRNLTILILNPTTKEHWIFNEFFDKKQLEGGENTVIDNVMYIHTSYKDVDKQYIPKNIIRDYDRLLIENPDKYFNIVDGGWIQEPEGVLLPKSTLNFQDVDKIPVDKIIFKLSFLDPADSGTNFYSMPFLWIYIDEVSNKLYVIVKHVVHNTNAIVANTSNVKIRLKEFLIEQLVIEKNGIGVGAVIELERNLRNDLRISPIPENKNKEMEILSNYEFVRDNFIFPDNYLDNPEFKVFINHLTQYLKGGDNKNRTDAIDVLCKAARFIKLKYNKFIYG